MPDGNQTDLRRPVLEAAEAQRREDSRFDLPADIPFDRKRLIFGTFTPLQVTGRTEGPIG